MEGTVYFFQVGVGEMGVDLGSGDRRVAEHRLNASDVRAIY